MCRLIAFFAILACCGWAFAQQGVNVNSSTNGNGTGSWIPSPQTYTSGSGKILAVSTFNAAGTPVKIDIYPDATDKPDEGNASVVGTVAWAAAQLTSGGLIFVHQGAYTVGTTITLAASGTHLLCANPVSTTFTAANSFNSIMFKVGWQGALDYGMEVRNCGFNGNNGSNTSGQTLYLRNTNNAIIENNFVEFSKINAIYVDAVVSGAVQNQIVGNNLFECGQACLVITNAGGADPTDSVIDRNSIGGSVIGDGTQPWVTVTSVGGLQFTNNHISGPGHTDGAYFTNTGEQHVVVSHNIFESNVQNGLVVAGSYNTITDNMFYLNGSGASATYEDLYILAGANDTILGNVFDGSSRVKYGVYSDQGAIYNTITGNTFISHTSNSISLANAYAGANVVGPNIYNGAHETVALGGDHYAPTAVALSGPPMLSTVPGELNSNGIALTQIASGPTPTITTSGTAGTSTWTYVIVPKDINGQASAAGTAASTTTGNATLTGSNYNVISWPLVSGAYSYDVYRTAKGTSPSTLGFIGNVLSTAATSGNGSAFLNDTGLAGNGATAPTVNTTGSETLAGILTLPHFTVATLPSASAIGGSVVVTDASTFTPGTCTGGGSDTMIAVSNGTSWSCH